MAATHQKRLAEAATTSQQTAWTIEESFPYLALKATTLQQCKVEAHEDAAVNQSNTTYRHSDLPGRLNYGAYSGVTLGRYGLVVR
jgi:hypothetical protein